MTARNLLLFVLALSTFVGCRTSDDTPARPAPLASAALAPQPSSIAAQSTLDAMDRRTPVPLLPMMANHQKQNMRDHLLVVQEVVAAVGRKDFDAVQTSVSRIGYSEQMGQMCEHMGAGAPGFTELALKFHHTADKIGGARKDARLGRGAQGAERHARGLHELPSDLQAAGRGQRGVGSTHEGADPGRLKTAVDEAVADHIPTIRDLPSSGRPHRTAGGKVGQVLADDHPHSPPSQDAVRRRRPAGKVDQVRYRSGDAAG